MQAEVNRRSEGRNCQSGKRELAKGLGRLV